MEPSYFINDADLLVEYILLFKTGMDNVLRPYKEMQKDLWTRMWHQLFFPS